MRGVTTTLTPDDASSTRLTALRMSMDEREKFQMEMEKAISDERYAVPALPP